MSIFDRVLIAGAVLFLAGWAIVFADSGSRLGGVAVYVGTGILLILGVVALARWLSGSAKRA